MVHMFADTFAAKSSVTHTAYRRASLYLLQVVVLETEVLQRAVALAVQPPLLRSGRPLPHTGHKLENDEQFVEDKK